MKPKINYSVVAALPPELAKISELAYNLAFSWKGEIAQLFHRMDPALWAETRHNPVQMLGLLDAERLASLADDQGFLAQLDRVYQDFERYLTLPRLTADHYSQGQPFQVAYFSAEFGLAQCLPIYSGGLGVLAGDHLKSASDLNLPLAGVGLMYQEGYFSQYLSSDGWQMETYPVNDFPNLPMRLERDSDGRPLIVSVDLKGETVSALIWRVQVGRISLFLLDTNLGANSPDSRRLTAQLYGGDREMRLRQEILLGIGGVRALQLLGIEPTVVHMNEGHSAFSALERIRQLRRDKGLSFDAAREVVLASTVFTTHTPVPAGNDEFDPELVRAYFEEYCKELGISFRVLLGYGRVTPRDQAEPFGMTVLALRLSSHCNGVSRLHGEVSRSMWQPVWPHHPVEDVPIDHITNGIHVPTWISEEMAELFDRYLGPHWSEDPDNQKVWEHIESVPDTELWRTHERRREHVVGFARRRLRAQLEARGASRADIQQASEVLSPDVLTIGFARRFATYKRATLLFKDQDRLAKILNHPQRPVQIIIAGKAHPADNEGKAFIKTIFDLVRQERFRRRVVFLEDYNILMSQHLVAGTDVWLNTPRRPLEACGTSGMKALANGSLNLSVLDGWWDEAYFRDFGWALGHGETYQDLAFQDAMESSALYELLEREVAPLFYDRGADDLPRGWVDMMRAGLRRLVPIFNAHRMVQEYASRYYLPCSMSYNAVCADDFRAAEDLAAWRNKLMTSWSEVSVAGVSSMSGAEMEVGRELEVNAQVRLGSLTPDDVTVEAYFGPMDTRGEFAQRDTALLEPGDQHDGLYSYTGRIPCARTGRFGFTVRVTPSGKRLENRFAMGLVTWA